MESASDSSSQLLSAMDSRLPEGSPSLLAPAGRDRLSSTEFFLRRLCTVRRLPESLKLLSRPCESVVKRRRSVHAFWIHVWGEWDANM